MTESALPRLPALKTLLLTVAGFFALTLCVYGSGLHNDFVRWDDGLLVFDNPVIREISPRSLAWIFTHYDPELYIPLTFLSYQVDWQIGGQDAFVYHLGNLVWHTLNALLAAWLLFLLSRKQWVGLLGGLLFAVHPLHTEAVEWVSARKDVLSTFFFLASLIAYMHWREDGWKRLLALSLGAFTLGLLSKVMVITLPAVLLLVDWYEGRRVGRAALLEKLPYLGIAAVFGVVALFGKSGVIGSSTLWEKLLMACKSAAFYLEKLFWPSGLSVLYPYTKPIVLSSPDFFVPLLVLAAVTGFALWSLRWGRGVVLGLLFFLVTVAPTFINFAKGEEADIYFASDRYAYLPSVGVLFAILWLAGRFWPEREFWRKAGAAVGGVAVLALAVLAYGQSLTWKDTEALFRNVLARYPDSTYVPYNNLANAYRLRGELSQAAEGYERSIAIKPTAKAHANLGAVYRKQGDFAAARAEYAKALALSPRSREAELGLGLVALDERKPAEAEAAFRRALEIDPAYEEAHTNLGVALLRQGDAQGAAEAYRDAIDSNPYFPDAHYNFAVLLESAGTAEDAIAEYEITVGLVPQSVPARLSLGVLYARTGKTEAARGQFEAVQRLDPGNAQAASALRQLQGE